MKFTREQIKERWGKLPENVKTAMSSVDTADKIEAVSNQYKLHIDQMGVLSRHIGYLMLGLLPPSEFIRAIAVDMKIETDAARAIAREVNEQIFAPIRESLKQIHQLDGTAGVREKVVGDGERRFDDRIERYLATNQELKSAPLRPYTQNDPYREPVE